MLPLGAPADLVRVIEVLRGIDLVSVSVALTEPAVVVPLAVAVLETVPALTSAWVSA